MKVLPAFLHFCEELFFLKNRNLRKKRKKEITKRISSSRLSLIIPLKSFPSTSIRSSQSDCFSSLASLFYLIWITGVTKDAQLTVELRKSSVKRWFKFSNAVSKFLVTPFAWSFHSTRIKGKIMPSGCPEFFNKTLLIPQFTHGNILYFWTDWGYNSYIFKDMKKDSCINLQLSFWLFRGLFR